MSEEITVQQLDQWAEGLAHHYISAGAYTLMIAEIRRFISDRDARKEELERLRGLAREFADAFQPQPYPVSQHVWHIGWCDDAFMERVRSALSPEPIEEEQE